MKKQNWWIYAVVAVGLAVVGYFIWKRWKTGQDERLNLQLDPSQSTSANTGTGAPRSGALCNQAGPANCMKILKKGDRGLEVCILQKWLNQNKPDTASWIAQDGIFGPQTEAALKAMTQGTQTRLMDLNACPK